MAKKRVLTTSLAVLASASLLAVGCRDKNEYGAKQDTSKNTDQIETGTGMNGGSTYEPGIANYPDTQGNSYLSGTGYYDSTRAGVAGSAVGSAGITTDTVQVKAKAPQGVKQKSKRHTADTLINDQTGIDSTYPPATGPGNPGGMGGSGTGSDVGTPESGAGTSGGTGGGMSMPGSGGSNSGSGTGGY